VLALSINCAPAVAPTQIAAIAKTESGFQTLAIHDNTTGQSYQPSDKNSGVTLAQTLLARGHSIDVGMMQINSANFGWLDLTLEDAFEPCPSIKAGAAVLTAISRYNTGDSRAGIANGYVKRVRTAEAKIKGIAPGEPTPQQSTKSGDRPPHDSNVFPDEEPPPEQGRTEQTESPEDKPPSADSSGDRMSLNSEALR
jgi:type IV secretion system protein VirB1